MYATLLGWPGFRKGMDTRFQRHDGTAVRVTTLEVPWLTRMALT